MTNLVGGLCVQGALFLIIEADNGGEKEESDRELDGEREDVAQKGCDVEADREEVVVGWENASAHVVCSDCDRSCGVFVRPGS